MSDLIFQKYVLHDRQMQSLKQKYKLASNAADTQNASNRNLL